VELSDKIGQRSWSVTASGADGVLGEVVEALTGLGFTAVEARRAARAAQQAAGADAPLEALLKAALRHAGSGA
jgi:Holliday junction resolvasome RuvABC DNA-binding subunit